MPPGCNPTRSRLPPYTPQASQLIVLRRGGISEAELARWLASSNDGGFSLMLHQTSSSSAHNASPLQPAAAAAAAAAVPAAPAAPAAPPHASR